MATEPFLGEVRAVSFNFAPKGWALCNGQLLAINQNQALFSILGTTYGGDGIQTFGLPNLQGRVPVHMANNYLLGQVGGVAQVTLNVTQVGHSHPVAANTTANAFTASGNFPAAPPAGNNIYGPTVDTAMNPGTVLAGGGSQPHSNLQPYLVVTYVIALRGIFPSRN